MRGSRSRRRLVHLLAVLALVAGATFALPGRFLRDPVLLDSLSVRVKGRVLSTAELFHPDQTAVVNPYYRPLFTALHELTDEISGGSHAALRLLALACHAFAALGLARYGQALRLRRPLVLGALLLFLLAPPNVATAAWPVVGYWTLAAGLCFFAAADLVAFVATGRRSLAARATALFVVSLLSSETGYQFVALLPLLALVPPRGGSIRARALFLWPLFAGLAVVHFAVFEAGARGLVTAAPLDRVRVALSSWLQYLESPLGGDALGGARPIAWAALALMLLGVGRSPRRRFLVAHALLSPLPFAAIGHNDRCAYFGAGILALAFVACAPRGAARLVRPLRRLVSRGGSQAAARRLALPLAAAALVVALGVAQLVQARPRLEALRLAGQETRELLDSLAPLRPRLADPMQAAFVNCPPTLKWAVWDLAGVDTPLPFQALVMRSVLCTRDGYFAPAPLEFASLGKTVVIERDGARLVERSPARPLGEREPLPWIFLAGGLEPAGAPPDADAGPLALQLHLDRILARTRELERPLDHVLVERELPELAGALPTRELVVRREPLPAGLSARAGLFPPEQLVAEIDVDRAAFLVAVIYLGVDDPLRRVTGDTARSCDQLEAGLDGAPAPIVPAFGHGCGVVVPKGRHVVVLREKAAAGNAFAAAPPR